MIHKSDCVYEKLSAGEIYSCHMCKDRILSDYYAILKGVVADGGQQLGVQKHKEAFPTPGQRKKFYMVVFHQNCFEKLAGNDFTFQETK